VFAGTWQAVPRLAQTGLPVLLVRGETSNTLLPPAVARLHRDLPNMTYAEIPGHGHLFPQSAPDAARQIISGWLDKLPG
jgi:pimeloyl-ACP methyl ester carboxylesterase